LRTRRLLPLLVLLALPAALALPSHARAETVSELCSRLTAEAGAHEDVTLGVVLVDLASGGRCEVNAGQTFRTASLYKLMVMAEAYAQQASGALSFDESLLIEPRHSVDDPEDLQLEEAVEMPVWLALHQMIQLSDNPTAWALRERLGFDRVAIAPERLGMASTELGDVFETTPEDIATFFEALYAGRVVDGTSSAEMLEVLKGQQVVNLIPVGLRDGTEVAHKTGLLEGVLHDAGVVFAPAGDYVLVAMAEHSDDVAAYEAIQSVSALAYASYSGSTRPHLVAPAPAGEQVAAARTQAAPAADPRPAPTQAVAPAIPEGGRAIRIQPPGPASTDWIARLSPVLLAGTLLAGVAGLALVARRLARQAVAWRRGGREAGEAAPRGQLTRGSVSARSWLADPLTAQRAALTERGLVMRFGSRKGEEDQRAEEMIPASASITQVGAPPVLPSQRLQRVAEHFHAQAELLEHMRRQFQDELQPLNELLVRQSETMHHLLQNLEERLRPLNEYADGEEANLDALQHRMGADATDYVARSFAAYLDEQRRRIAETRQHIDHQRVPFLQYAEDQRDTVEVALGRFDDDVQALESNLSEQRRVMMRMLDAMRSDTFTAVKEFLSSREEVLAELAQTGATDPGEVGRSVQALRESIEAMARESGHVQSLLSAVEESDRRLAKSAPAGPRPLPAQRRQAEEEEARTTAEVSA
jgi:beta-lactamase class A/uncharacterized membrane-anchored protein YhcB (DUF1043 family)